MSALISDRVKALIVAQHHEGKSVPQIAEAVAYGRHEVWQVLRDAGIARPAHTTRASLRGDNLADPNRADAGLRRF